MCKDAQGTHKPGVKIPFQQCMLGSFPLKGRKCIFRKTTFFFDWLVNWFLIFWFLFGFLPNIFAFAHDQGFILDFSYN